MDFCNYCAHKEDLVRITKLSHNGDNKEVKLCEKCLGEMSSRGELYQHQRNHDIYLFTANADPQLHSRLTFSKDRSLNKTQYKF